MKWLADFRKRVIEGWTVQRIAAVLIVVGLAVFTFGAVTQYCTCAGWPNLGDVLNHMIGDFYANVSVDCLSVAFAILVIDRLNERRDEEELKAQLIRELGGSDHAIALRSLKELRAHGWIEDGSLRDMLLAGADLHNSNFFEGDLQGIILDEANLTRAGLVQVNMQKALLESANLQNAIMFRTNLREAHLKGANFSNAILLGAKLQAAFDVTDEQLLKASSLKHTVMANGVTYDGRYNLGDDIQMADWYDNVDVSNPEAMAGWYGVTLEEYLASQEWAREHLAGLRRSAGLDPDTGWRVEPTNGVEPQPADALASPAPRRNGHKASMVTHRVRW